MRGERWTYEPEIGVIEDEQGAHVASVSPFRRPERGPLLAAAPDLYEALVGLLDRADELQAYGLEPHVADGLMPAQEAARAALAKARGEGAPE